MRRVTADIIFTNNEAPIYNGVITLSDQNEVLAIDKETQDFSDVERYDGIICPGFVNVHCHLELSHLAGKLDQKTGLENFVQQIQQVRSSSEEEIQEAIENAEAAMIEKGIVAVGDISNGTASLEQKNRRNIYYHTFIEVYGFDSARAVPAIDRALEVSNQFTNSNQAHSIVPHATYSVSNELFEELNHRAFKKGQIISMHNQECEGENELFATASGPMVNAMASFGNSVAHLTPSNRSALPSVIDKLPETSKMILVHNTYSGKEDVKAAINYFSEVYWCLCPKANLYIEDRLPDVSMLEKLGGNICLGTDSLASNSTLSILEEMKTIQKEYNQLNLETLIKWGTLNGAEALSVSDTFGTIETGKTPGLNLIQNINMESLSLKPESTVTKIA